eukprot:RCo025405
MNSSQPHRGPYTRHRPAPVAVHLPMEATPSQGSPYEASYSRELDTPEEFSFLIFDFPDISSLPCPRIYVRELPRPPPRRFDSWPWLGALWNAFSYGWRRV